MRLVFKTWQNLGDEIYLDEYHLVNSCELGLQFKLFRSG